MTTTYDVESHDYSLTGPTTRIAHERGLADADWFQPEIDAAVLRDLQTRSNVRAAVNVVLWLVLLVASGVWAWTTIWSWWSIPAFVVYGALYGGAADSRWHECGHGTAFRAAWTNDVVYYLASFLLLRGPTVWRWSHYRHHTDTIIVGLDAEIVFQRPPDVGRALLAYTHLQGGTQMFLRLVRHAAGRIDPDAADFVPEAEQRKIVLESRIFVGVLVGVAVWSLAIWSIVPLMFIGLPSIYGAWLVVFFGITQHAGMRENVLDHRYNTRTVYMNPIFRFLYMNMNYHVEHHVFPSVPFHALPSLHNEIKSQLAPALPTTVAAYREIFGTLVKQQREPTYEIPLDVPDVPGAPPHRIDVGESNWVHLPDGTVDLGAVDSVEVGELRRVDVEDRTYVLCRLGDDEYTLGDGLCTHAKFHLAGGALVDGQIECPKHNGRFDARTGEPIRKPVRRPLGVYHVERIGDRIISRLDHPHEDG